jgi:cobalt-zinc-cadmium efflux system outer membrane protein
VTARPVLVPARLLLVALAASGCVRYQPRPLDPARHPAELRARRLDDPALLGWMRPYAGAPSGTRWSDRQLALAALAWRAELARARAEWRAALAAAVTAGERPAPGVQADVERRVGGRDDGSPWVVSLAALGTVELGGKRGARLLAARARAKVAESRLVGLASGLAAQTRAAALGLAGARAEIDESAAAVADMERVSGLEQRRYAEAALAGSELARTRTDVQASRAELARAEQRLGEVRAELAAALAVPVAALADIEPAPVVAGGCARLDTTGRDSLVGLALTRRAEVVTALAAYAVAEADVRLEVARRYPDLEIAPGFIWDQGVHRWTLAVALPALLGLRHKGPIRQAEAERVVAARRVAEAQDSVILQVEAAAEECRGARLALRAADSVVAAERAFAERVRAAYQRGETAGLEPARAELLLARAERNRRAAQRAVSLAGITLEAAAAEWPDDRAYAWPDPREEQPAQ